MKDTKGSLKSRNATRDLTLFNLSITSDIIRLKFVVEFQRLSRARQKDIESLMSYPTEHPLCYVHINHSRYAQKAAFGQDDMRLGTCTGKCVFKDKCCNNNGTRLRPLTTFNHEGLQDIEKFEHFEDAVSAHSSGMLNAKSCLGMYACSQCLYLVTEGKKGTSPTADIETIPSVIDRWIVRWVLFALDLSHAGVYTVPDNIDLNSNLSQSASLLRKKIRTPYPNVRMILFTDLVECRNKLINGSDDDRIRADARTMERIIRLVLASRGIHLRKISSRSRFYMTTASFGTFLNVILTQAKSSSNWFRKKSRTLEYRKAKLFDEVTQRFVPMKKQYWKGKWDLQSEISSIPKLLWTNRIIKMASKRRISIWNLSTVALGKTVDQHFLVSNSPDVLPIPSIEYCLSSPGGDYLRADLINAIRTLKLLELIII